MSSAAVMIGALRVKQGVSVHHKLCKYMYSILTLLHSERPKLYIILAFLSAVGLITYIITIKNIYQNSILTLLHSERPKLYIQGLSQNIVDKCIFTRMRRNKQMKFSTFMKQPFSTLVMRVS